MGRPLKKVFFGNTSTGGQQIEGYAWTAGDSQARLSYIVKQKSTSGYVMASSDGTGTKGGSLVYLVNGAVTTAGEGNIKVEPYGTSGVGATATANLGVSGSPSIYVGGTGDHTADYVPGQVLQLQGGTYTGNQQANVTVTSVNVRTAWPYNPGGGGGYAAGDYFIFGGPGFTSNANIRVATVDGGGNITSYSVVSPGVFVGNVLPSDPVTANVVVTSGGSGATWGLGWQINAVSVTNSGDYTTIPANPVSLAGSAAGTGAQINVSYSISSVKVTAGGADYDVPPNVTFSTGSATAHAVVSGGSVTNIVIDSGGSGYTSKPTVGISANGGTGYARKITDRMVYLFDGREYQWLLEGDNLPGPGWAHIKST